MDELRELLRATDKRVAYHNQLEFLKEEFRQRSIFSFNGHQFVADLPLVWLAERSIESGQLIALDQNQEPVMVLDDDINNFLDEVQSTYYEAMNSYYEKYTKLRNAKSLEEIVGVF